eukprot:NODE_4092_length_843_cov_5.872796_g3386_i0.p2 GENE.NODE_4092_length_843_cov_5.872796_g3386_i0~~NODE_4092_length_843_cov_5.872796_g3386_i0.p2  ORF type:complete len:278 (-),score=15.05 NODE_4092_length_843_cov_5.872796_g3386_i0:9-749(-)
MTQMLVSAGAQPTAARPKAFVTAAWEVAIASSCPWRPGMKWTPLVIAAAWFAFQNRLRFSKSSLHQTLSYLRGAPFPCRAEPCKNRPQSHHLLGSAQDEAQMLRQLHLQCRKPAAPQAWAPDASIPASGVFPTQHRSYVPMESVRTARPVPLAPVPFVVPASRRWKGAQRPPVPMKVPQYGEVYPEATEDLPLCPLPAASPPCLANSVCTSRAIPVFQQLPRSLNDSDTWSENAISEEGSQGSCVY